jgi:hypothetical protein
VPLDTTSRRPPSADRRLDHAVRRWRRPENFARRNSKKRSSFRLRFRCSDVVVGLHAPAFDSIKGRGWSRRCQPRQRRRVGVGARRAVTRRASVTSSSELGDVAAPTAVGAAATDATRVSMRAATDSQSVASRYGTKPWRYCE